MRSRRSSNSILSSELSDAAASVSYLGTDKQGHASAVVHESTQQICIASVRSKMTEEDEASGVNGNQFLKNSLIPTGLSTIS